MNWIPPEKPNDLCESRIIQAILLGQFPPNDHLPAERELAVQLGVTRPTLREALQRLARDGWIDIQHGKPTRVRNYLQEGNLAVLAAIAQHDRHLPQDFVSNLLTIRHLLAPAYTRLAVQNDPQRIFRMLERCFNISDTALDYAIIDWSLHHTLTVASANPVFTLILNGFHSLYIEMGKRYFTNHEARAYSQDFYQRLYQCALNNDPPAAETLCREVMQRSLHFWQLLEEGGIS